MKSNRFISDHPEFGAFLKKELDQLRFIAEVTGTNQEKEIDKRLDRLLTIDKVLKELEKKK